MGINLAPCVLISLEYEHILIWRGRDWRSSLPEPEDGPKEVHEVKFDVALAQPAVSALSSSVPTVSIVNPNSNDLNTSVSPTWSNGESKQSSELTEAGVQILIPTVNMSLEASQAVLTVQSINEGTERFPVHASSSGDDSEPFSEISESKTILDDTKNVDELVSLGPPWTEGVLLILKQAIECGSAMELDDHCLDADKLFKMKVAFAKTAPTGLVFRNGPKKLAVQRGEKKETGDLELKKMLQLEGLK
ncbi:unnamed protein product [Fraxinus pennsylvanica]|uniref:Uncharacterized protein n=1 Tax=Fraxinus pennsylvanica TaxID=56036 RepID=A0AAD2A7K6_9LAMI|nr:unnamed protein product [Fraxinus pennsylvanica]